MSYKQWAEGVARDKRATFLITSFDERDDDGKQLFWSNEDGWVDKSSATRYTYDEMQRLHLPIDGYWTKG